MKVEELIEQFEDILMRVKSESPLIHCITNPISINACANVVLAMGAKPIMAEHPLEVEAITSKAGALAVNLGNITDARMQSIIASGHMAKKKNIPSIIDLVGVTCSKLREELAFKYIKECAPAIIKGNISEVKTMAGVISDAPGIDVSDNDIVTGEDICKLHDISELIKEYAADVKAVVIASGVIDIVSDGADVFCLRNGSKYMSGVTGTGCMLNVCAATLLSNASPLCAAVLSTALMGVCGELADAKKGLGTYAVEFLDKISTITPEQIIQKIKIETI